MQYNFVYCAPLRSPEIRSDDCGGDGKSPAPGCPRPREIAEMIKTLNLWAKNAQNPDEAECYRGAIGELAPLFNAIAKE